jgi:hypothetical protein
MAPDDYRAAGHAGTDFVSGRALHCDETSSHPTPETVSNVLFNDYPAVSLKSPEHRCTGPLQRESASIVHDPSALAEVAKQQHP